MFFLAFLTLFLGELLGVTEDLVIELLIFSLEENYDLTCSLRDGPLFCEIESSILFLLSLDILDGSLFAESVCLLSRTALVVLLLILYSFVFGLWLLLVKRDLDLEFPQLLR